jgi:very-short-patch-repair endonuclease
MLQLDPPVDHETALSVMYALERGIEAEFQLEDQELDSELLPPDRGPRDKILLTESAEGGAGVLRRLQSEKDALRDAARRALRIAHFDPDTGIDLEGVRDPGGTLTHKCARGCYNCLLSYGNQLVHELINRHAALPLLLALAGGETVTTGRGTSRTDDSIRLIGQTDSELEANFIGWLKDRGHRLPDAAQVTIDGAFAKPDFVYRLRTVRAAIFIDGPAHDASAVAERDVAAETRLENRGWYVIRVRWDDDWQRITDENPSVFGQGRRRSEQDHQQHERQEHQGRDEMRES